MPTANAVSGSLRRVGRGTATNAMAAVVLWSLACGGEIETVAICQPGELCFCEDGARGTQVCDEGNRCVCSADAGDAGDAAGDSAGDSGQGDAPADDAHPEVTQDSLAEHAPDGPPDQVDDAPSDVQAPDAGDDAPSDVVEETPVCDGELNACGGCAPLGSEPGESCGACADGELVCNGSDDVRCSGATEVNVCGGCDELPTGFEPGEACCGDVSSTGIWQCSDLEAVCRDANNAFGESQFIGTFDAGGDDQMYFGYVEEPLDEDWVRYNVRDENAMGFDLVVGATADHRVQPCIFFAYMSDPGADIYPYSCAGMDTECVVYDTATDSLATAVCASRAEDFDPERDLAGCCDFSSGATSLSISAPEAVGGTAWVQLQAGPDFSCYDYSLTLEF